MVERDPDNIKLAVLEEKVFNMVEVISKLDDTIEKLSDLSVNVSKMLAVHEEKLEFARESAAETAKDMDDLEDRMDQRLDDHSSRIRSMERRIWIGLGIALAVAVFLQTPFFREPAPAEPKSAIIVPRN